MTWLAVLNFLMIAMIISVLSYFVYEQVRIRDATNKNDTDRKSVV